MLKERDPSNEKEEDSYVSNLAGSSLIHSLLSPNKTKITYLMGGSHSLNRYLEPIISPPNHHHTVYGGNVMLPQSRYTKGT